MNVKSLGKGVGKAARMMLALAFVLSQSAWAAETQATKDSAASKAPTQKAPVKSSAVTAQTAAVQRPATQTPTAPKAIAEQTAAEQAASRGGNREGIKVHGHWTIEVRDPDGTVVTHREFENALSPGFNFPFSAPPAEQDFPIPGGAAFLSALLSNQMEEPVTWGILLEGPSPIISTAGAPCAESLLTHVTVGVCILTQSVQFSALGGFCPTPPSGLSCNLVVSPVGPQPNFTGFQLSGSVVATQSGSVSAVVTVDFQPCNSTNPNCAFEGVAPMVALTAKSLDGLNGDPQPVSVSAGQTIAVTVAISFS